MISDRRLFLIQGLSEFSDGNAGVFVYFAVDLRFQIISHMDDLKGALAEKVKTNFESARLCRKMATIIRDFDMNLNIEEEEINPLR